LAANKVDLLEHPPRSPVDSETVPFVPVSAKTGYGTDILKDMLLRAVGVTGESRSNELYVGNARQWRLLTDAADLVERTVEGLEAGRAEELVAFDFQEAVDRLGAVTGEGLGDAVLDEIFSQFCIGK